MKKIVSFLFISFISCNEASEDAKTELKEAEKQLDEEIEQVEQ